MAREVNDLPEQARARPMGRGRLWLVHAVLGAILVGHLYDIVRQQEHWPFSNYPMWARLSKDWHIFTVVPVGITHDSPPQEVALMDEAYFAPMPLQYQRITFQGLARSPRRAHERDKLLGDYLRHYERRRAAGLHNGPPLVGLRLYERYLEMDKHASTAAAPGRTTLRYEYRPTSAATKPTPTEAAPRGH